MVWSETVESDVACHVKCRTCGWRGILLVRPVPMCFSRQGKKGKIFAFWSVSGIDKRRYEYIRRCAVSILFKFCVWSLFRHFRKWLKTKSFNGKYTRILDSVWVLSSHNLLTLRERHYLLMWFLDAISSIHLFFYWCYLKGFWKQ